MNVTLTVRWVETPLVCEALRRGEERLSWIRWLDDCGTSDDWALWEFRQRVVWTRCHAYALASSFGVKRPTKTEMMMSADLRPHN